MSIIWVIVGEDTVFLRVIGRYFHPMNLNILSIPSEPIRQLFLDHIEKLDPDRVNILLLEGIETIDSKNFDFRDEKNLKMIPSLRAYAAFCFSSKWRIRRFSSLLVFNFDCKKASVLLRAPLSTVSESSTFDTWSKFTKILSKFPSVEGGNSGNTYPSEYYRPVSLYRPYRPFFWLEAPARLHRGWGPRPQYPDPAELSISPNFHMEIRVNHYNLPTSTKNSVSKFLCNIYKWWRIFNFWYRKYNGHSYFRKLRKM